MNTLLPLFISSLVSSKLFLIVILSYNLVLVLILRKNMLFSAPTTLLKFPLDKAFPAWNTLPLVLSFVGLGVFSGMFAVSEWCASYRKS
jgi:hypothetical protein